MRLWWEVRERLRSLLRRGVEDRELEEELRFHLESDVDARVRAGATEAEARKAALAAFGPVTRAVESTRDARGVRPLEDAGRDLRYGVRSLARAPGFTAVVILALGLGIGSATAMYSLLDGILLSPLPYPESERLYKVFEANELGIRPLSYPDFEDWREGAIGVMALTYARGDDVTVRGEEGAQRLIGAFVTGDFFRVVGTSPALGRTFTATEVAGGARVAVVSHGLWLDRFGGSVDVVGSALDTPSGSFTVVGVMPRGFAAPNWAELWLPLEALPPGGRYVLERRDLRVDSEVLGRLAAGVDEARATAALAAVARRVSAEHREAGDEWVSASLQSVREAVLGDVRSQLVLLAGAVGLLLLVACVNVTNLYLARATARARELGVRTALGASRGRIVRQLLTESGLLSAAGGLLGVVLAVGGVRAIQAWAPDLLPRLGEVGVNGRVLLVSLVLVLGTTLLVGLVPAIRPGGRVPADALRSAGARSGSGPTTVRARSTLVVAQIGLALVLVVSAGLLLRSLQQVQEVELGFDPDGIALVRVFPPSPAYDDEGAAVELYRRLREAAASVPGVTAAALVNHMPMAGGWMPTRVEAGTEPPPPGQELALFRTVSPDYFRVAGTELLRGRLLDDTDLAGSGGVVVNRTVADRFWPGSDPIGRTVTVFASAQGRADFGEPITAHVVGVVADERFFGPESDPPAAVYVPYTRTVWANIFVIARTAVDPERVIPSLRRALLAVDPDLPIAGPGRQTQLRPMEAYLADSFRARRVSALLVAGFGVTAFMLAALGIFGVMAYVVALRRQELGIRIALGAGARQVSWLVTRHALRLAAIGVGAGLAGSVLASRYVRAQLFEVTATDPFTYGAAIGLFAAVALIAAAVPAVRAARTDPVEAMRVER